MNIPSLKKSSSRDLTVFKEGVVYNTSLGLYMVADIVHYHFETLKSSPHKQSKVGHKSAKF